jgi:hypothetical protein
MVSFGRNEDNKAASYAELARGSRVSTNTKDEG